MSGFDADWLVLREPADRTSRSDALIAMAARDLARHASPHVCDLGSGTGAALRAFQTTFPQGTRWTLTDNDPGLLEVAMATAPAGTSARRLDLASTIDPLPANAHLVTATALFDLASDTWIRSFATALAAADLPVLATLTYNGDLRIEPSHPLDAAVVDAFNRHQKTDKGLGGPAAGPDAARCLETALSDQGYMVTSADTPWVLTRSGDERLAKETLSGIAGAAAEMGVDSQDWLEKQHAGFATLTVGHTDIYARPR